MIEAVKASKSTSHRFAPCSPMNKRKRQISSFTGQWVWITRNHLRLPQSSLVQYGDQVMAGANLTRRISRFQL
jgi:hypothetical protein